MSPYSRDFPLFIRKVLGANPTPATRISPSNKSRNSKVELAPFGKTFTSPTARPSANCAVITAQLRQLVRAALKFHKPIAM